MDWSHALGPAQPLSYFLKNLKDLPRHWWLYIPVGTDSIGIATSCRPRTINSRDISPEEADELDAYPRSVGLVEFISPDQLMDVVENLRQQEPRSSEEQLVAAINYYWNHDAFINLGD